MKKRTITLVSLVIIILLIAGGAIWYNARNITIKSITLTSPYNSALLEDVNVVLDKPASIYVRYWKKGGTQKQRTPATEKALSHTIHLVLLEPNTTYEYEVVVNHLMEITSETASFQTRPQSPWLVHNWIKDYKPHEAKALGDGLVMLCYAGRPGYIALVDGTGAIRWYWQVDDIGVRAATLTPRGTLLALLHPSQRDEINDIPDADKIDVLNKINFPIRRGRIGYAGGTALAEIDLSGKMLWRLDLPQLSGLPDSIIHHDLRMDKDYNILTFMRDPLPYDLSAYGGKKNDTLSGDMLVKMDTTGKILWKWSPWTEWDFKKDNKLNELSYDRFHMNALYIDKDGNYLVSPAIENQIWKVNSQTGRLMWKLGKGGDFTMDTTDYFYFQHGVNIDPDGDVLLFNNGDPTPSDTSAYRFQVADKKHYSSVLSFHIDTAKKTAITRTDITLPKEKFSSRMGSAYQLPNKNFLVTSSKTGTVMVLSPEGKILWELNNYFIPYRAEYIPAKVWDKYFVTD